MLNTADTPRKNVETAGRGPRVLRAIAIAGFPLSLSSPGATVSVAVIMLYGVYRIIRGDALDDDLKRAFRSMFACYVLVVAIDLVNGGGLRNIETAFNYLPLLAMPPFAHAIRRLNIPRVWIVTAIQSSLWLAFGISMFRMLVLGEARPGGINLVSIGFGFVVAVWAVVALSLAIDSGRKMWWQLAGVVAGCVTVMATESKINLIVLVVGAIAVGVIWAVTHGRWRDMMRAAAVAIVPLAIGTYLTMAERFISLWNELAMFVHDGYTAQLSFGLRYELNISGLRAFLDSPIVGHGFAERMSEVHAHTTPGGPDISTLAYVHNDYVTHMVAYGMLGLAFIAAYFVLTARLIARVPDDALRRAGLSLLVMMAVYMNADIVFNMDPVTGLVTILVGVILSRSGSVRQDDPQHRIVAAA